MLKHGTAALLHLHVSNCKLNGVLAALSYVKAIRIMKINCLGRVGGLVFVALGFLTVSPVRGDTNGYVGSKWALVDASKVQAEAAETTPAKYPNCDVVTVDEKSVRVYRADGTGESQDESFVKVLTEKGRRASRTLSFNFMLPYSTVDVAKLEVMKPDGQLIPVDVAANSKESIDDSGMAMNIYDPNERILRVNIPQLETGDVVHAVVRQTTERAIIPGEFDDENIFEGPGYIRHQTYEVHAPADHPLRRIALRDEVPGTVKQLVQTNADKTLTYHLGNQRCAPHVRRTQYAALRNGFAKAPRQHRAGLAVRFKMVLEFKPVAPERHHAGNETDGG